jgi:phosphatidate cytidylyltransferase
VLLTRVIAALIFAPALLALTWLGGWYLALACVVIAALALGEFVSLTQSDTYSRVVTVALGLVVAFVTLGVAPELGRVLVPTLVMTGLLASLFRPEPLTASVSRGALVVLGALYGGGLITYLARLRELEQGLSLSLLALFCTWGADTGAYFAGRAFGRHKLYPKISPGKTVEGGLGGVVAAIAVAFVVDRVFASGLAVWALASVGAIAAVLGALGDLAESMIKRAVGAKDSSRLIPGHGGVLDRFDSVMFVAPAVYAFVTLVR